MLVVVCRYNIGIGLSCMLLLLVTFMYVGLCFGACGESAGNDARLCNRGIGACLLLVYDVLLSSCCFTFCLPLHDIKNRLSEATEIVPCDSYLLFFCVFNVYVLLC